MIGQYAFCGCSQLTAVLVPEDTTIKDGAFDSCSGLDEACLASIVARYAEDALDDHAW